MAGCCINWTEYVLKQGASISKWCLMEPVHRVHGMCTLHGSTYTHWWDGIGSCVGVETSDSTMHCCARGNQKQKKAHSMKTFTIASTRFIYSLFKCRDFKVRSRDSLTTISHCFAHAKIANKSKNVNTLSAQGNSLTLWAHTAYIHQEVNTSRGNKER